MVIVIAMGLGLFMNAAIPDAFDDRAWAFVIPLLAILFFAGAVTALDTRTDALREHFRRTLIWIAASAPLWIAGAAVSSGPRLWWWAASALIDLTGTWLALPLPGRTLSSRELAFDAEHMLERLRLFFIILLATAGAFIARVSLWAAYFGGSEDVTTAVATTTDLVRSVRLGGNSAYLVLAALAALRRRQRTRHRPPRPDQPWTDPRAEGRERLDAGPPRGVRERSGRVHLARRRHRPRRSGEGRPRPGRVDAAPARRPLP